MKKNLIQRLVDKLYKLQKRVQDRVLVEKVQNQQVAYRLNQKPRKEQVVVSLTFQTAYKTGPFNDRVGRRSGVQGLCQLAYGIGRCRSGVCV